MHFKLSPADDAREEIPQLKATVLDALRRLLQALIPQLTKPGNNISNLFPAESGASQGRCASSEASCYTEKQVSKQPVTAEEVSCFLQPRWAS